MRTTRRGLSWFPRRPTWWKWSGTRNLQRTLKYIPESAGSLIVSVCVLPSLGQWGKTCGCGAAAAQRQAGRWTSPLSIGTTKNGCTTSTQTGAQACAATTLRSSGPKATLWVAAQRSATTCPFPAAACGTLRYWWSASTARLATLSGWSLTSKVETAPTVRRMRPTIASRNYAPTQRQTRHLRQPHVQAHLLCTRSRELVFLLCYCWLFYQDL